jgi:sterol 3beta-glucosyltransferase
MDIIFLLSGTRGDIQPFLGFMQRLHQSGHRIRVVADEHAKDLLELKEGLSFYPVEGDQVATIKDWVKSRGRMGDLTLENIRSPEVKRAQDQILLQAGSFWDACTEPWERATKIKTEERSQNEYEDRDNAQKECRPFIPDVVISNNQADMAIHCAEKLGLPLLQLSTFPWHPTREFPFILSSPENTNFRPSLANLLSHKKGRFM